MVVDLAGNKIIDCIRITNRDIATCITSHHDGVCRVLLDVENETSLLLGAPAHEDAAFVGPVITLVPLPETNGHLYEKLVVKMYEGQVITFGSRVSQLYTITTTSSATATATPSPTPSLASP